MVTNSAIFGDFLNRNKLVLATAESCTAGLIAATVAETPGSSAWLSSGYVVYTPEAKNRMLGVSYDTIKNHNITSVEVAEEMVLGALENTPSANVAISVTGVAGPGGGTKKIPVGTICIAWAYKKDKEIFKYSEKLNLSGSRNVMRANIVAFSLEKLISLITKWNPDIV